MKKKFTFFWSDGTREVIEAEGDLQALKASGFKSPYCTTPLDFYRPGEIDTYKWVDGSWQKKSKSSLERRNVG